MKRRRSSLVSSKYSTTLNQHGQGMHHHGHLVFPNMQQVSQRASKKLFNLRGRNKRANAQTLAQHMKTLNMVSVYLLVSPKSASGSGGGGGAGSGGGSGGDGVPSGSGEATAIATEKPGGGGSDSEVVISNGNVISGEDDEIKPVVVQASNENSVKLFLNLYISNYYYY